MTTVIDCTFRDGGYYNNWDFPIDVANQYLVAMKAASVDYVEIGFRFVGDSGYKGAFAFSSDDFIRSLEIPEGLKIGVMMNAADLFKGGEHHLDVARRIFVPRDESPVALIRFACHLHEFANTLEVCAWLKEIGYVVGINLMQIADRSEEEIESVSRLAAQYPLDVLYFADSMGSMSPAQTSGIISILRRHWSGAIGIHTHDNMCSALANTMQAVADGATWVDATVTGMGRGPGNAKTEYLLAELKAQGRDGVNITPLLQLVRDYFHPMQEKYGWGTNTYYYLAGRYAIHPTYVQEMLSDSRYSDADILAVIEYLREEGGKKFSFSNLEAGRTFYRGEARGQWAPQADIAGKEVLIVATGPSNRWHRAAIERYIRVNKPYVIALNLMQDIDPALIDARAACHPVRMLADCGSYREMPQPLICPASMLPEEVLSGLAGKQTLDFGLAITPGKFSFSDSHAAVPTALVIAYALAAATSGRAARISLVGFDGYGADDPRNVEMDEILALYRNTEGACQLQALTPTRYRVPMGSIYRMAV